MCLNSRHYRLQVLNTDRTASARDVITLKLRSEDGNHTFILKMCLLETIGQLRHYLDSHRWDSVLQRCQKFFLSFQHVATVDWISCITEVVVSPAMTSSACTRSAATMTTARRSSHVGWRLTLLCCCEWGNVSPSLTDWSLENKLIKQLRTTCKGFF